jgi:hypothetical protein
MWYRMELYFKRVYLTPLAKVLRYLDVSSPVMVSKMGGFLSGFLKRGGTGGILWNAI